MNLFDIEEAGDKGAGRPSPFKPKSPASNLGSISGVGESERTVVFPFCLTFRNPPLKLTIEAQDS